MTRHRHLLRPLLLGLSLLLLCLPDTVHAKARGLGFVLDDDGGTRKVSLHTGKSFTSGRGFPFIETPVAMSITRKSSAREEARLKLDPHVFNWISSDSYPLDGDRIVLNGRDRTGRNHFVAVWNWRRNRIRTYDNVGSESPESITGISPDEKWAVSVPAQPSHGLVFHDLERGTATSLYEGLNVHSPRFSPDSSRWAFFSGDELIVRSTTGGAEKRSPIPAKGNWRHPRHLAWSPSGRYIAGIVSHQRTDLVVWDPDGNLVKIIGLPGGVSRSWPPVWSPDEKGVHIVLGNEGVTGKWQSLQTRFVPF